MDISKNYTACPDSDAAIILLLGSGGSTPLTKGVSKWLVKQGVNVLSLGPEDGVIGYHNFPVESKWRKLPGIFGLCAEQIVAFLLTFSPPRYKINLLKIQ